MIMGLIEDVDIHKIKCSADSYRDARACSSLSLEELSTSISHRGLLQPIIVRTVRKQEKQADSVNANPDDVYNSITYFEIVAGNRRYQACKALGWRKIVCHIVELDDKQAFEVSLIENIQRKTLNPIEEAYAFKKYVQDFGWGGISDLAYMIGKSVSYVDKRLRLLDLPSQVIEKVSNIMMGSSIAEELIPIHDANKQSVLAEIISNRRLSLRKTRELVRRAYLRDNSFYDTNNHDDEHYYCDDTDMSYDHKIINIDERARRSFDKSIIAIKVAMNGLGTIMQNVDDNWIIYEILREHKNMLHAQIDLLIREKKRYNLSKLKPIVP
jgi:ParB family transcriptional regulator, chromosome partitioning protein